MKNKLVKTNMTRFDYLARRLGIIGFVLFVMCFSVALPIATNLINSNKVLYNEIQVIQETKDNENNHQYNVNEEK